MKRGLALPCVHLRLADDAACPAPAFQRGPAEVPEPPGGLAAGFGCCPVLAPFRPRSRRPAAHCAPGRRRNRPGSPPHHTISASRQKPLSPRSTMRTRGQRARIRRTRRINLLHRARSGIAIGRTQFRRQQVAAAEDVKRQVAVTVVIAVEEPAFLMSVQRVVGGVEVERDLRRRLDVGIEEEVDEQVFDRRGVGGDFRITAWARPCSVPDGSACSCPPPARNPSARQRACRPALP